MLISGWEDLALNAWTLLIIMIDPYYMQNPFNVLITELEEEEALSACDPYFWQSSEGHKNGLPGPQK